MERISTSLIHRSGLESIQRAQQVIDELQNKLGSGKRLLSPSEDPQASSQLLSLRSELARNETYQRNLDFAERMLIERENAVAASIDVLFRARELLIQGNTASMDSGSRQAIAAEVAQLKEQLVALANTKASDGTYLFAGQAVTTQPFSSGGAFLDAGSEMSVNIAPGMTMSVRQSGEAIFEEVDGIDNVFSVLDNIAAALNTAPNEQTGTELSTQLGKLDLGIDALNVERSSVGTKLRRVDDQRLINDAFNLNVQRTISQLEDLDYAKAISDLNLHMVSLQAAQQAYVKTQNLSIFNYL